MTLTIGLNVFYNYPNHNLDMLITHNALCGDHVMAAMINDDCLHIEKPKPVQLWRVASNRDDGLNSVTTVAQIMMIAEWSRLSCIALKYEP